MTLIGIAGLGASLQDTESDRQLIDDGRTPRLEDVSGLDCLACHAEIGEEWRLHTPELMASRAPGLVALLSDPRFGILF